MIIARSIHCVWLLNPLATILALVTVYSCDGFFNALCRISVISYISAAVKSSSTVIVGAATAVGSTNSSRSNSGSSHDQEEVKMFNGGCKTYTNRQGVT